MNKYHPARVVGILALTAIVLTLSIYYHISQSTKDKVFTEADELPDIKVALVLGTSKYTLNGWKNSYFHNRIKAASDLYHSGKVSKILVSGDNAQMAYNEPIDMMKALIKQGVAKEDIVLDYAGFRTFDSMVRAKEVFGQDSLIVISQKFHVQRALYIAEAKNIYAIGYVAPDPPHSVSSVIAREYLARVKAFIDCYVTWWKQPRFLGEKESISL